MKINLKREIDLAEIDNVKKLTISTSTPCESWIDGKKVFVILEHTESAIDFAWISDGCPIRYLHDGDVIARALDVHLEGEALVSTNVIWGESNAAQKVKADVLNKILTNISVEADYTSEDCEVRHGVEGETIIVRRWRPLACAIVVNGADPSCRIEREYKDGDERKGDEEADGEEGKADAVADNGDEVKADAAEVEEVAETATADNAENANAETDADADNANGEADGTDNAANADGNADNADTGNTDADGTDGNADTEEANTEAETANADGNADNADTGNAEADAETDAASNAEEAEEIAKLARHYNINLDNATTLLEARAQILRAMSNKDFPNKSEKKTNMKYSILRALKGAENEVKRSNELAQICGKQPKGVFIERSYDNFNTTEGAGLVHTEHDWTRYVPELLSNVVLGEAGANVIDGLVGKSLAIPVSTQGATGTWIAEDGTVQGTEPKTGTLTLTAKTCAAQVTITHALLNSGLPQADEIVSNMVYEGLARNIQRAALQGSGEGAEPTGIVTAVTPTEWQTTPTYAQLVALEGTIPDGIDLARCVYVMTPAMFAALRGVAVGDHAFAAEFREGKAYVLNRPALLTSDAPANTVIFGDFAGLYIGMFSPIDVFEDKYSGSNKLQVKVIGSVDVGIGVIANRFAVGQIAEASSSSSAEEESSSSGD